MKPRLALNILRALILVALALLAGFVVFCLAASAQAVPAAKATKPVVKLGQPYFAVRRRHRMSAADANALYLYWRDSVQFAKPVKK